MIIHAFISPPVSNHKNDAEHSINGKPLRGLVHNILYVYLEPRWSLVIT